MKKLLSSLFVIFLFSPFLLIVEAQGLLPDQINDLFGLLGPDGSGTANFVTSRVQLGLVIALGIVLLIAVVFSIISAVKYISSQGDSGQIEEAQKAIKAIFFGIGAMLISVVGIVIVFVFFGATQPDASLYQVCISAPESIGCRACIGQEVALPENFSAKELCDACEAEYRELSSNPNATISPACGGREN